MFTSVLFRKSFLSILLIVVVSSVTLYSLSVPMIKETVFATEEASAKAALENAFEIVTLKHQTIVEYQNLALEYNKRQLKNITLIQESFIKSKYNKFKQNLIPEEEAKRYALEELREFRYGNDDYVWVSDYNSFTLSHPDPKLNRSDTSNLKDINGIPFVPSMVAMAREKGDGYASYWWQRLGENNPVEKLSYIKDFSPWKWVIGTGFYVDDVKLEVDRRQRKMVSDLRALLQKIKIGRMGYVFIFDSKMNMIIHPNSNIENTNFSNLVNPITGTSIGRELIAAAARPEAMIQYKWDRLDDKNNYSHDAISWIKYHEPLGWYVASTVYVDELNSSANRLRNRLLWVCAGMAAVFLLASGLFLHRLLIPLKSLLELTQKVEKGDFEVRCNVTSNDEIGALATGFNRMVDELRSNINGLDQKISDRSREIEENNIRLESEISERTRVTQELKEANELLKTWVKELETRNREIALLNRMGDMLQTCRTLEETFEVITQTLGALLPEESGALYMSGSSDDFLEMVAGWGVPEGNAVMFRPEDCWGVRRSKSHRVEKPGMGQACPHIQSLPPYGALCVPMIGQGELLGMLHLKFSVTDPEQRSSEYYQRLDSMERLTQTVADNLSLVLANLKLRERLQVMSVRDPLTGLYNRRYMQETLEREIKRAERENKPIGIMVLDVDHFKKFNDTYGHEIGDRVLKALGDFLLHSFRGEDVACRFGGEEFVLIMPGLFMEDSLIRAERVRAYVEKSLRVQGHNTLLNFTVSIGVSLYPTHGITSQALITKADAALYHAKKEGRNRIALAECDQPDTGQKEQAG